MVSKREEELVKHSAGRSILRHILTLTQELFTDNKTQGLSVHATRLSFLKLYLESIANHEDDTDIAEACYWVADLIEQKYFITPKPDELKKDLQNVATHETTTETKQQRKRTSKTKTSADNLLSSDSERTPEQTCSSPNNNKNNSIIKYQEPPASFPPDQVLKLTTNQLTELLSLTHSTHIYKYLGTATDGIVKLGSYKFCASSEKPPGGGVGSVWYVVELPKVNNDSNGHSKTLVLS